MVLKERRGIMRRFVFYIDTFERGGAQRVMLNLIQHFVHNGNEVILVNDAEYTNRDMEYVLPQGIRRLYLHKQKSSNAIVRNLFRMWKLRKIVKKEKPDIILSFLGWPNLRMLISTIGLATKKIVSVRNDPNKEYGESKIKKIFVNFLFCSADGIVFQTNDAAKYFCKKVQRKSRVIFNPVGDAFYGVCRNGDGHGIITCGRLMPQKNHKMLIDAFAALAESFPDEELFIYGDGPLREQLNSYVENKGLADKVIIPGAVKDVTQILSVAKIFVLPSDFEGMPNALIEAMAVGVPVISTDCPCGGPRMILQNSLQGILVKCGDKEDLINALRKVLLDAELRKQMSAETKERASIFRVDVVCKQWEQYFESMLSD